MESNSTQGRNWVFTINNPTDADDRELEEVKSVLDYLVYAPEVGEEGTPHYQGYLVTKSNCRMSFLKKRLTRAHFETRKAPNHKIAADYCKGLCEKKGNVLNEKTVEWGEYKEPKDGGKAQREEWETARQLAKQGRFDEIPAYIYCRSHAAFQKIFLDSQPKVDSIDTLDFHLYWGLPGVGKSLRARAENPDHYIKPINKWWDGYSGQECVIIDDMEKEHAGFMLHFLKLWCDHYPFVAETKGGSKFIRPKKIIITSNYCLMELYPNPVERAPLERRIQVEEMYSDPDQLSVWLQMDKAKRTKQ